MMLSTRSITALPLALASAQVAPAGAPPRVVDYAQVVVRSHVVIRVQAQPFDPATPLQTMFRERKGPACIGMADVAGAAVIAPKSVDFALRSGKRMRARFASSCPALAYYSGFYILPTADGMLCAGRDAVRDRAGGECEVEKIRELTLRK